MGRGSAQFCSTAGPNVKLSFLAQSYEAAVTLDPDQAQAWMNMGGIRHIQVGVALTALIHPGSEATVHFLFGRVRILKTGILKVKFTRLY